MKLLAIVLGAWIMVVAIACLSGCMRCDPFQLACPEGKACVDGYCRDKPKPPAPACHGVEVFQDTPHTIFGVNDCYICKGAFGCVNDAAHYCCLDSMCSECSAPPVPGMFGKHAPDAGVRRDAP